MRLQQQEKEWEKVQQRQQLARSPVAPHSASAQMFKHCVPHTHAHIHTYTLQSLSVCVCVSSLALLGQSKPKAKQNQFEKPNQTHGIHTLHYTRHYIHCTTQHTVHCTRYLPPSPLPSLFAHCMREGAFCLKFVFEWKTFVKINYEFVRSIVFR